MREERRPIAVLNECGQPVGPVVSDWRARASPPRTPLLGRFCRLEILDIERHAPDLHEAYALDPDASDWTYLPYGPFASLDAYKTWLAARTASGDPLYHIVVDVLSQRAIGTIALMRMDPENGVIEIGNVRYSRLLQRQPAGTEAVYLLLRRVFDELGYRRCEWKCHHLNARSRRTAERLGFTFEGTFRQAVIQRGRSRDTDWLSIIDSEWPPLRAAYEAWLSPSNFDADGRQREPLRVPKRA